VYDTTNVRADDRGVAARAGHGERRYAIAIRGDHRGARANEEIDDLHIAVPHRPVERRRAVGFRAIGVGLGLDERAHGCRVAILGRLHKRDVRGWPYAPYHREKNHGAKKQCRAGLAL
jgi:hypothetical protein